MSDFNLEQDNFHKKMNLCGIKISSRYDNAKFYKECSQNYKRHITRLKNKIKSNEVIRVLFYVTEKQKWGYQSLYEELDKDPLFEPIIVVGCITDENSAQKIERCSLEENMDFFKEKGLEAFSAYEDDHFVDLLKFKPDIIFYQQPWYIPDMYYPTRMSKYALCCYCSYSIATSKTASLKRPMFFYNIWKYFLAHDCMKEEYLSWMKYNTESLIVTGHPKLDVYKNYDIATQNNKHYVIYAPHFSLGPSILSLSTFDWSGQLMLDYAKKHPEINWVFKPHPVLRNYFLRHNIMTKEELDNYYNEWEKLGLVYTTGDYFDIFKESDAMITDCSSFCTEYFFTGKPLLHLISQNSKPHSALNRLVNTNHYSIFNRETLEKYMDEIIIRKNDFLKDVRLRALKEIFPNKLDSSHNIINYIKEELK